MPNIRKAQWRTTIVAIAHVPNISLLRHVVAELRKQVERSAKSERGFPVHIAFGSINVSRIPK